MLKGSRVQPIGGGPTGIVEEDEPDETGRILVRWGYMDGKAVRVALKVEDLEPAPPAVGAGNAEV